MSRMPAYLIAARLTLKGPRAWRSGFSSSGRTVHGLGFRA